MKRSIACLLVLATLLCPCLAPAAAASFADFVEVVEGDQGPLVKEIRLRLMELGYIKSKSRLSHFTGAVAEAYMEFQFVNGFLETGVCTLIEYAHLMSDRAIHKPVKISYSTLRRYAEHPLDFSTKSYTFGCRFLREEPATGTDLNALCYMDGKTKQLVLLVVQDYWTWDFVGRSIKDAPELVQGDGVLVNVAEIVGTETRLDEQGNTIVIPVVHVRAITLRNSYFHR